jgi:hypothetical protein
MIVLLSETKTMKHRKYKGKTHIPVFSNQTDEIVEAMKQLTMDELHDFYNASDNIVNQAHQHWQSFDDQQKTMALFAFQGEAFRNLDATTLTPSEIKKADKHLRILSACYGLLRPLDMISLYRLDFTKNFPHLGNGISYWRDIVTDQLIEEIQGFKHPILVNCSSKEYTQMIDIERVKKKTLWIQVNFDYIKQGKSVFVSMHAKAARGTLARELLLRPISSITQMNRYLSDYSCKIDKKNGAVTYTKTL